MSPIRSTLARLRASRRFAYACGEASNGLTLILFVALARMMGVEPYGQFIAIVAGADILARMFELGFPDLLPRTVAREPDQARTDLRAVLRRQLWAIPVMLLVLEAYFLVAGIERSAQISGLLIGSAFGIRTLKTSVRAVCMGLERFGLEATSLWIERTVLLALGIAVVSAGGGLLGLSVVFLAVRAIDFAVFLSVVRHRLADEPPLAQRRTLTLSMALPFAATSLLWALYYQVDTAMLAMLATEHDTGVYGAVYRFVDILQVLPRLVVVVAYPVLAVAWTKERTRFAAHAARLHRVVTAYGLPALFLVVVWAAPLIGLVFGSSYSEGSDALAVLAVGCYFAFHGALLVRVLNASGGERSVAVAFLITVVANIILNALLIPRHGFFGAAVATLITELCCALLLALAGRRSGAMAGSGFPVAALGGAVLIILTALFPDPLRHVEVTLPILAAWGIFAWRTGMLRLPQRDQ